MTIIFAITICFTLILLYVYKNKIANQSYFVINEVCGNNFSGLFDNESNDYADWIELYNISDTEQSLEGYSIQTSNEKEKITFEELVLGAHSYIVIYCNDIGEGATSADFKISNSGDELFLLKPSGEPVDSVQVPALGFDESYARVEDGGENWSIMTQTPYQTNSEATMIAKASLSAPTFSIQSGFYEDPFSLQITVPEGTVVFYTTDGSDPTVLSNQYTGPISIIDATPNENVYNNITNISEDYNYIPPDYLVDKANVIRAAAFDGEGNFSETTTGVYFVGFDEKDTYEDTCVISIVTNPDNLFDDDTGIYVTGPEYDNWYQNGKKGDDPERNYEWKGSKSEREAIVTCFDENHKLTVSQNIGLRIQGNSNRKEKRKRFSFFSREEYSGSNFFEYDISESGKKVHSYSLFKDNNNLFVSKLLADRELSPQSGKRCYVFLDGEYWDQYYLVEKITGYYFSEKYNYPKDDIILIKNREVSSGKETDRKEFDELDDYLTNADFTSDEAYEELCSKIDMQSFLDHFCSCIYLANLNWRPENNHILWKTKKVEDNSYGDGRWRWVVNDFDMSYSDGADINAFTTEMHFGGTYMTTGYLPNLLRNETFKQEFVTTFMDLANKNFTPENTEKVLAESGGNAVLNEFLQERPQYASQQMKDALALKGELAEVEILQEMPEAGEVVVNTITPDLSEEVWTGKYFTDYPITLTASAHTGYHFAGWNADGKMIADQTIEVQLTEDVNQISAVFEKN